MKVLEVAQVLVLYKTLTMSLLHLTRTETDCSTDIVKQCEKKYFKLNTSL